MSSGFGTSYCEIVPERLKNNCTLFSTINQRITAEY
jgi:hypothetical protein